MCPFAKLLCVNMNTSNQLGTQSDYIRQSSRRLQPYRRSSKWNGRGKDVTDVTVLSAWLADNRVCLGVYTHLIEWPHFLETGVPKSTGTRQRAQ